MARKPTRFWHPARRLLIEAQEKARTLVASRDTMTNLEDVQPRLQHYLRAMYGEALVIETLVAAEEPGWAVRVLRKMSLVKNHRRSESTADCMRLPQTLGPQLQHISPLEQYRVMAVHHAERMRRQTAKYSADVTTELERDLFQLAEAASIDARIAENQPGLRSALDVARADSIDSRPRLRFATGIEHHVERLIRKTWHLDSSTTASDESLTVPRDNDAQANATWARRTAVSLEAKYGRKAAQSYRSVPEITLWQTEITTLSPQQESTALETEKRESESSLPDLTDVAKTRSSAKGSSKSHTSESADDDGLKDDGKGDDSPDESKPEGDDIEDERGTASTESSSDSSNESSSDHQTADSPIDATPGVDGQLAIQHSDQPVGDTLLTGANIFRYPEWDYNTKDISEYETVVCVVPPQRGSSEWARTALVRHAREVNRAKQQFERLRSHRLRLRRQVQGDELDLEACVEAMIDRRMNVAPTDRLYSTVRPGRRELAITLLVDVSGSTRDVVAGDERVIDIERVSALIATAAFDALGDDYSILAFSSASASNVRVHTLKDFGERSSSLVLERISALEPHGTTRLGAAVRHASAILSNHPAPHRLLLIISDGKPFDYDWYFVDYAVQDSRHAVMSARLQGIHPFCITVDTSDEDRYLPDIFGTAGYRIVNNPAQLSQALLQAVQRMLGTN